jgi:hypothetical protein
MIGDAPARRPGGRQRGCSRGLGGRRRVVRDALEFGDVVRLIDGFHRGLLRWLGADGRLQTTAARALMLPTICRGEKIRG